MRRRVWHKSQVAPRLVTIAAALILGVLSTIFIAATLFIAVTGGALARSGALVIREKSSSEYDLSVMDDGFGVARASAWPPNTFVNSARKVRFEALDRTPHWLPQNLTSWFRDQREMERYASYYAATCGFPFRCFVGERRWTYQPHAPATTDTREDRHFVTWPAAWTPDFLNPRGQKEFLLPTRIMPVGFAANSTAYGTVWFFLITAPGAIRRWRRKRQCLCAKCGYDLHGVDTTICPECGDSIKANR